MEKADERRENISKSLSAKIMSELLKFWPKLTAEETEHVLEKAMQREETKTPAPLTIKPGDFNAYRDLSETTKKRSWRTDLTNQVHSLKFDWSQQRKGKACKIKQAFSI